MKSSLRLATLVSTALFALTLQAATTEGHGQDPEAKPAPSAAQRADYPLKTCVVSGDDLDEMGHPVSYTYKEAGKADRVVLFCCKDCIADFEKEPAKYLATLDAAAAKKASEKK